MSNTSDFIIENGVLKKYVGPGGDVVIPEGVTSIADHAFFHCRPLERIVIPDSVTNIGALAFDGYKLLQITDITILPPGDQRCAAVCFLEDGGDPSDPRSSSHYKFIKSNARKLMNKIIANPQMLAIVLREKLLSPKHAIAYLDAAQIAGNEEAVAMLHNYDAGEITPSEKQQLLKKAVSVQHEEEGTRNAHTLVVRKGVLKSCKGNPCEVIIPEGITEIGKEAFIRCYELSKVVIPEGVKTIGECAFFECTKLKEVVLPNSLEVIGGGAFGLCPLTDLSIPEGVTTIGGGAFCNSKLQKIVIPKSVKSIGGRAFDVHSGLANVSSVTNVTILADEITLGGDAFTGGFGLELYAPNAPLSLFAAEYKRQIIFTYLTCDYEYSPERNEEYKKYINRSDDFIGLLIKAGQTQALSKLLQIKTQVKLEKLNTLIEQTHGNGEMEAALLAYKAKLFDSKDVERIEERKMDIALGVKSRTVGDWKKMFGFEKYGDGLIITAYKGEEEIVEVPAMIGKDTVIAIGESAFSPFVTRIKNVEARRSIKQILLPDTIKEIGKNAFKYCSKLESILLPESVTKIGDRAFDSCSGISEVVVPSKLQKIERIFTDCKNLSSVVISSGVKTVGSAAFSGCNNLSDVTIPNSVTFIDGGAFYLCSKVKIKAPAGSYAETYAQKHNIPFVVE